MIDDSRIVFVTTSLGTKWMDYQQALIYKNFPGSPRLIVSGRGEWPDVWKDWIPHVQGSNADYYVHIDEDCMVIDGNEMRKVLEDMELNNIDLVGCPDGNQHYRDGNPVAMNSFLMFGRVSKLREIDLTKIRYRADTMGYHNNLGLKYRPEWGDDFHYPFPEQGGHDFSQDKEPYYAFFWALLEKKAKFKYLFPYFDQRFKSTNPRISLDSNDMALHMWYTRCWSSEMDVWGLRNCDRYALMEQHIQQYL